MKKLIKSYRFWTALSGSVGLLVVSAAKIFGVTISSNAVEDFIMAICGVLVVLGIVKKPKSKEKNNSVIDDKSDTEEMGKDEKDEFLEKLEDENKEQNLKSK